MSDAEIPDRESPFAGAALRQLRAWSESMTGGRRWVPIPVAARLSTFPEFTIRTMIRRGKVEARRDGPLILVDAQRLVEIEKHRATRRQKPDACSEHRKFEQS